MGSRRQISSAPARAPAAAGSRWRRPWIVAALVVAAMGAAAGWRAFTLRSSVLAHLPARPDLARSPAALVDRISAAEHRARGWRSPARGLDELGRLYHANGFLKEAQRAYRGLMDIDPRNARWPFLAATILAGFGQLDDAVPLLRRTIALAPDYLPAHVRLGEALAKSNRASEAAAAFSAVPAGQPEHPHAALGLARSVRDAGNLASARDRLRHLVEAEPGFTPAWALLATIEGQLGNAAAAAAAKAREQAGGPPRELPDPWVEDLFADCYDAYRLRVAAAATTDGSAAERWLQRAIEVAPNEAAPHRQLGDLLTRRADYRAARGHLERAVRLAPNEADNWAYLLRALDLGGDTAAGDRALATGLAHCPQSPSLHLERGRRLQRAGQLDAALAEFETSRRLRPQEVEAYVEMSTVYFRLNRVDQGIAALRGALAVEPAHPVALSALAFCAIGLGDEAMARQTLQEAKAQPRMPAADMEQLVRRYGERFGRAPW